MNTHKSTLTPTSEIWGQRMGEIGRFAKGTVATCGALWVIANPAAVLIPQIKPEGWGWYVAYLAVGVLVGAWQTRRKKVLEIAVAGRNTTIRVREGDLFHGLGVKVIPVNDRMSSKIGHAVAKQSVHGQFLMQVVRHRDEMKPRGYDYGEGLKEVGEVRYWGEDGDGKHYLLAVLTETDPDTLKASATFAQLQGCLRGICDAARHYCNGQTLQLPLIGGGQSNTGIPSESLLNIIVTSLIEETRIQEITKKIEIVLPKEVGRTINLRNLAWRE